jgi:serine/threonine protein kinase
MDSAQAKIFAESLLGRNVGGWKIDGTFGNGKSAVVFSAEKSGVKGALKVFHPELIERYGRDVQLARIEREKSLIGQSHPHLVTILDGGACSTTGHLFVVMEQLPYKNLHDARSAIPAEKYATLISQVASAARFLEDLGLAHRDIKPENIAVTENSERAILLDLGVLLPVGLSDLTDACQRPFIGTLRYSSPEFLDRKEQDTTEGWRAVTFYQMGAVLHDLIMQKPLFEEASEPFSILVHAVHHTNPSISGGDPNLMHLARRALVKDPVARLQLVEWSDFENAAAPPVTSLKDRRQAILQRQKLSRVTKAGPDFAEAEVRRLFLQRMDQFSRRLDTRLASVLAELACFPLRSCSIEPGPDDARNLLIQFSRDEKIGMPYALTLLFTLRELVYNEGSPQYVIACSAAVSTNSLEITDLQAAEPIFKGSEEDLYSGSLLQEVLMDALAAYYEIVEAGPINDGSMRNLCLAGVKP